MQPIHTTIWINQNNKIRFHVIYLTCYFIYIFFNRLLWIELFSCYIEFCNFYLFNLVCVHIFYYITPIYRVSLTILPQFLSFTEKYCMNRTHFHFRRRAETWLRCAIRLSKTFSTAHPDIPIRRADSC